MNIRRISDLLEAIDTTGLIKKERAHQRIWFRGQPAPFDLKPGVYRDGFTSEDENARIFKERNMFQDFKVFSASFFSNVVTDTSLYFLQQHYGMPTRLLDWSTNPLSALYFSVSSFTDKDGELFMMDANGFSETQTEAKRNGFKGIATGINPLFAETIKIISEWRDNIAWRGFIIPVRPNYFDKRITLQRGCFTFHVPKNEFVTVANNNTLVKFTIPKADKPSLKKDLALLGIDEYNIYGDLNALANTLKANYKT